MNEPIQSLKISIYISTFNRVERLQRAVESVLCQRYQNIEILICDDASSDGTQEYVNNIRLKDDRIIYLRNETNKGACATRNLGINAASGYFITGLDDDDEFKEDRLSYFLKHWDNKYSFLCANFTNSYPGDITREYYKNTRYPLEFNWRDILFENEASNQIFTLTRRLKDIGGFDPSVKRLQDWDTWLRLSFKFGTFLRLPVSTYIMHHDHSEDELRVSKNEKITEALTSLVERNRDIYSEREREYMLFLVSSMNGNASLYDSLYWSVFKFNPKYFIKYMLQ